MEISKSRNEMMRRGEKMEMTDMRNGMQMMSRRDKVQRRGEERKGK
jgi:hypothetical protein